MTEHRGRTKIRVWAPKNKHFLLQFLFALVGKLSYQVCGDYFGEDWLVIVRPDYEDPEPLFTKETPSYGHRNPHYKAMN